MNDLWNIVLKMLWPVDMSAGASSAWRGAGFGWEVEMVMKGWWLPVMADALHGKQRGPCELA